MTESIRTTFYFQTDYQMTSVGKIPKDWEVRMINDLFSVKTGTTPSTAEQSYWNQGAVNWLTPTDLSRLDERISILTGERRVTEKAVKEANLALMPKGSIILSTRAPVGYVAVLEEPATFSQGCKGLIPRNSSEVCPEFYAYYLKNKKNLLQSLSGGSTFKELSKETLERLSIVYLKSCEQRGIVEVLSCVDLAIQKTEEVIAKTEHLKKGLMQKLLTEGIGHKEFKDTEIGKIPREWEVVRIGDKITLQRGYDLPDKNRKDGQFPVIGSNGIVGYHDKYMTEGAGVIVGRSGTLGKVYYYEKNFWPLNTSLFVKQFRNCHRKFIFYFLQKIDLTKFSAGTSVPTLNRNLVHPAKIAFPKDIKEQEKIAEILTTIDQKLSLDYQQRTKLECIKNALMDLLLSGKVRVRVD